VIEPNQSGHVGPSGARVRFRVWDPESANGETVILIQGLGLSGRFWFHQPERLAALGYRAITLDNRGTGESDPLRGPFRLGMYADDVIHVLDALSVERAFVAGISMGGMIAQHVAIRHPSRVKGLVLLATTPGMPEGRLPPARSLRRLFSLPFRRDGGKTAASLLLSPRDMPRAKVLLDPWAPVFAAHPLRPRTFALQLGAIALHSTARKLRELQIPAVVVAGAHDLLVPPRASEALAKALGAHFELLPDVGHAIPSVAPDVIERALARLLSTR
jgi:pimeloyl-ACP methyl ester carboxylesterase